MRIAWRRSRRVPSTIGFDFDSRGGKGNGASVIPTVTEPENAEKELDKDFFGDDEASTA